MHFAAYTRALDIHTQREVFAKALLEASTFIEAIRP
ncbi:hypothetical protein A20C1_12747 [marine actinobacterium PHSC20C1]|nr:hypothetical protein A20C1_12747 [marine actinobacterium PHSC20C1]